RPNAWSTTCSMQPPTARCCSSPIVPKGSTGWTRSWRCRPGNERVLAGEAPSGRVREGGKRRADQLERRGVSLLLEAARGPLGRRACVGGLPGWGGALAGGCGGAAGGVKRVGLPRGRARARGERFGPARVAPPRPDPCAGASPQHLREEVVRRR